MVSVACSQRENRPELLSSAKGPDPGEEPGQIWEGVELLTQGPGSSLAVTQTLSECCVRTATTQPRGERALPMKAGWLPAE